MQYIDTGARNADEALGTWLVEVLAEPVSELRFQSGFFAVEALGVFVPTLHALASDDRVVRLLIGSNSPGTAAADVRLLVEHVGLPRSNGQLGVVRYSNAFFHPKVYHLRRSDGSSCAYVGSANLTPPGLRSQHIEAGVLLDTRAGDPPLLLERIATAIDDWFDVARDGLYLVNDAQAVDDLEDEGILAHGPPPSASSGGSGNGNGDGPTLPSLHPLVALPSTPAPPTLATTGGTVYPSAASGAGGASAVKEDFPGYLLFAPDALAPTQGANALSGSALPGNSAGLILRLNNDSARHFGGTPGTANVSVPVATLSTLRFGIRGTGNYPQRPRAEYQLVIRYIAETTTLAPPDPVNTNVMAYGFLSGETGHGDVRLVVPAAVKYLAAAIEDAGLPVPQSGHVALLEWPTVAAPLFRLSFIEEGSALYSQTEELYDDAAASHHLVGDGACWLPPGLSPSW